MKQKVFISYSRRQTPFVDRFASQLDKSGYAIWLDYQRLIPARPWMQQIAAGIMDSDVVLLIVSTESIASQNVEPEWRHAVKLGKRIILIIFEATPLPPELQSCEWIDFRSGYGKSLRRLKILVDSPQAAIKSAAPQSGYKASIPLWLVLFLSLLALIGSIPAWWTILVPYILVPLPWGIYKRNYIFSRVIPVLLLLPVLTTYSATFFTQEGILHGLQPWYQFLLYPTFISTLLLLLLLLTPSIQRRVMPQAARVQFANPLKVDVLNPRAVSFAIDHAAEDGRYAEDLAAGLKKYGHHYTPNGEEAEAVFVLISVYKSQTKYDPDHQAVYPVLLQATPEIDPALQRIQWLDFRGGAKHIETLAKLLPEPERLLRALAVPPTGTQEVFPFVVTALQYFFVFTGIFGLGGLLISMISFATFILRGSLSAEHLTRLVFAAINGLLLLGTILYSLRGLRSRRHGSAAIYPLLMLTIFQVLIYFTNISTIAYSDGTDQALEKLLTSAAIGSIMTFVFFPVALLIVLPILLFRWNELSRWFPRRQHPSADRLENLFLLYSPSNLQGFIFQFLFHLIVLTLYLFILITVLVVDLAAMLPYIVPMLLAAVAFRWLAVRLSQ